MTVGDLENLEKFPPKIQTRRKNMKIVNSKAMGQFGAEAFSIRVDTEAAPPRLSTQRNRKDSTSPCGTPNNKDSRPIELVSEPSTTLKHASPNKRDRKNPKQAN